jgi:uncharacterized membrane protein HdeD (DUF308 family)
VLAIFSPAIAGVAVTVFFGWLLIFSGILHLAYAWQAGRPGAVVWEILLGILYGGIGFYLLARYSKLLPVHAAWMRQLRKSSQTARHPPSLVSECSASYGGMASPTR